MPAKTFFMSTLKLFKTAFTTGDYYTAMNTALKSIDGNYQMLHYPYYESESDTFDQAQQNLINYVTSHISSFENKDILDLGCGNGVVSLYLAEKFPVGRILGVDLNNNNVAIANEEKARRQNSKVDFITDDAQNLKQIKSNSFDVIINIESAFHYPDKHQFLNEIYRVLKPGGQFMIADIVATKKESFLLKKWKNKMSLHHWSRENYIKAFENVDLNLHHTEDISENVIKGFKAYRNYLNQFKIDGAFRNQMVKMFFIVNVKLNIYLLRKKRRYYIFHGKKDDISQHEN